LPQASASPALAAPPQVSPPLEGAIATSADVAPEPSNHRPNQPSDENEIAPSPSGATPGRSSPAPDVSGVGPGGNTSFSTAPSESALYAPTLPLSLPLATALNLPEPSQLQMTDGSIGPVSGETAALTPESVEADAPNPTPVTTATPPGTNMSDSSEVAAASLDVPASTEAWGTDSARPAASTPQTSGSRPSSLSQLISLSNLREQPAVPLQVIPAAAETLNRAEGGPSTAVFSAVGEPDTLDAAELQRVMALPALPDVDPGNGGLLRVPEGTIPTGRGSNGAVPVVAAGTGSVGVSEEAPPPPPSRAAMLGLLYRVLVPNVAPDLQGRVRELVPDAFRVEYENQPMIQAGAYPTETEAEQLAEQLQRQGLDARVVYSP
jgi:hypothetical protein